MVKVYKVLFSIVLVAGLLISSTNLSIVHGNEKYKHHVVLELNPDETDAFLKSDMLKKGNNRYLGDVMYKASKKDASLTLDFNFDPNEEFNINGEGSLKIKGTQKYKFVFKDILRKIGTSNGDVYFGPVLAEAEKDTVTEDAVLGLFFDPETYETTASLTIGNIDAEKGNAFLVFGENSELYGEALNGFIDNGKQDSKMKQPSLASTLTGLFKTDTAKAALDTTLSNTRFSYRTYGKTTLIGATNGQYRDSQIDYNTDQYMSNQVFGYNIYGRDAWLGENGQGMTYVAGWSNTPEVATYLNNYAYDPYDTNPYSATLVDMYIGVGNSNLLIDIKQDQTFPQDSPTWSGTTVLNAFKVPIKHPAFTATGEIADLIFTVFGYYQQITKPVKTVVVKKNATSGWVNYLEKRISDLDKRADFPTKTTLVSDMSSKDGGMGYYFYFDEQVDTTQPMYVKGRAVYMGLSSGTSSAGFYTTPYVETYYNHKFY